MKTPRILAASLLLLGGFALIPLLSKRSREEMTPKSSQTATSPAGPHLVPSHRTELLVAGEAPTLAVSRPTPSATVPSLQGEHQAKPSKSDSILDKELTEAEQKSLWQAFSEARREVREIPEA
ncbi:MAG: hypothetical protein ACRDBP_14015 [Luteolibacter sp.]